MLSFSGATALALLSLISNTLGQDLNPKCLNEAKWVKCQGDTAATFDCTTIKVAYDWANYDKNDPNRNEIGLKLIRARATNVDPDKAKSIIANPGGPGNSGIDLVLKGSKGMLAQSGGLYNIIGFDPRGTALNMPYSCSGNPSDPNIKYPGSIYPASSSATDIAAYFEQTYEYYKSVGQECAQEQPDLGRIISTIQTAQDVYAIAQAVGTPDDKMIRYWGYSYGTLLGNVIARLYPTLIDRMVLDGNIDPNSYYFDPSYVEASDVKRGTEHFFQMCAEAKPGNCAWTAKDLPAGATVTETAANMLQKYNDWVGYAPLAIKRNRTSAIDDDESFKIRDFMHTILKTSGYKDAAQTLENWYTGATPIISNTKRQTDDGSFDPNDAATAEKEKVKDALTGIRCVDNELRPSDLSGSYYQTWLQNFSTINPYSPEISSAYIYSCAPWVSQPTQNWGGERWGGLKTNTSIFVTPQQSAKNSKSYYSNSYIAYTNGIGHCTDTNPSQDLNKALVAYWTDATAPSQTEYAVDVQNVFDTDVDTGTPFIAQELSETLPDQPQSKTTKRSLAYLFGDGVKEVKNSLIYRSGIFDRRASGPVKVVIKDNAYCRDNQNTTTSTTSSSTTTRTTSTGYRNGTSSTTSTRMSTSTGRPSNATTTSTSSRSSSFSTTSTIRNGTSTTSRTSGFPYSTSTSSVSTKSTSSTSSTVTTLTTSRSQSGTWTSSAKSATQSGNGAATWNDWDPSKPITSTTTSKWSPWDPAKPTTSSSTTQSWGVWDSWTSQSGSVPVTKTVCATGARWCSTVIVAVPTQTVYVDYFVDVCPTGLITKTVTVTATCNKGCTSKPTGVPSGYTTKPVFCTACPTPSTVIVTVIATPAPTTGKFSTWASVDASSSSRFTSPNGVKPTTATTSSGAGWNTWPVAGTTTSTSASSSATGPMVAKYTGAAAPRDVALGSSLIGAVVAGLWFL